MKKLVLAFLILVVGAGVFGALDSARRQAQAISWSTSEALRATTNPLVGLNQAARSLRLEVSDKGSRLKHASLSPGISVDLLTLLEGGASKPQSGASAELRERLGLGWNASADYVLVSKRLLKQLHLSPLNDGDVSRSVLAISPGEQAGIDAALELARSSVSALVKQANLEQTEALGGIVAQFTFMPADSALEASISNNFSAQIVGLLGVQRGAIFLEQSWNDLSRGLAPVGLEPVSIIIRRSLNGGEPALSCELRQGSSVSTSEVRYANYPSAWFLTVFPGGWQTVAQRGGFELPKTYHP